MVQFKTFRCYVTRLMSCLGWAGERAGRDGSAVFSH